MSEPADAVRAAPRAPVTAIGLMSGTSYDGIDAAVIRTDGAGLVQPVAALSRPYPSDFRAELAAVMGHERAPEGLIEALTRHHADCVHALLAKAGLSSEDVDVIGFHGQTILHAPERGVTIQIGDGALLARLSGIGVVSRLRERDMVLGGQGAPLAPAFHAALAEGLERPLAVVNIGGVANATVMMSDGGLVAFDTGPGNGPIDDLMHARLNRPFDRDGALGGEGRVDEPRVAAFLGDAYFRRTGPRSLDRMSFVLGERVADLDTADAAATLAAMTARSIAVAVHGQTPDCRRVLVTGGGRHNRAIMTLLAEALDCPVDPVETVGWDGDAIEAQAFAYLAVRSRAGAPITFPGTTGVSEPATGGHYDPPGP